MFSSTTRHSPIVSTTRALPQQGGKSEWNGSENSSHFHRSKSFSDRVAGSVAQASAQATQPTAETGVLLRSPDKKRQKFQTGECGARSFDRLLSASICKIPRHKSRYWRAHWRPRTAPSYRAFRHEETEERVASEPGNSSQRGKDLMSWPVSFFEDRGVTSRVRSVKTGPLYAHQAARDALKCGQAPSHCKPHCLAV